MVTSLEEFTKSLKGGTRPSKDEYFLAIALLVATRATCARRSVGCVLVNQMGHILATGYNGVAKGDIHCIESPCEGAGFPSGEGLDACQAIHAEQNALLQCKNVWDIYTAYVTHSPCSHCVKMLKNTSCERIVFLEAYAHNTNAAKQWESVNHEWIHFKRRD